MNEAFTWLATFLGGVLLAYLYFRARQSAVLERLAATEHQLNEYTQRLQSVDSELRVALEARARAAEQAARVPTLEQAQEDARQINTRLTAEIAELKKAGEAEQEKIKWLDTAQQQLREAFQALAGQALRSNAGEFLNHARTQLETLLTAARGDWNLQKSQLQQLVQPLETTLKTLDMQVRDLEQKREGAYRGLEEHLRQLGQTHHQLQTATIKLEQALKSPTVRGSWGQVQLRRVVELAGMEKHVAFVEQAQTESGRPDMIVRLPQGGILPVDAKAPMQAFLDAMESGDTEFRKTKLKMHADAVKNRVRELSQKKYWEQFERSPECVVMFVPNDTVLSAAFEHDSELLEFSFKQRVLLTTPATLLALLLAVTYGWQQQQIAENAHLIAEQGKDLYERLAKFLEHLARTGKELDGAVKAYNEAIGSLESRVLPAARRFKEMGATTTELPGLDLIDRQSRSLALPESTAS